MKNRDNFPARIVDVLAKRASYICSNPECKALTVCPSDTISDKSIYIGEAAHITAAASSGPRYDESLTVEERCSIENAIFLCSSCATMIDKNKGIDFTKEVLRNWKLQHEAWVRSNLNKSIYSLIPKHISQSEERPTINLCTEGISVNEIEKNLLSFIIPYCSGKNANAYNVKLEAAVILDMNGTFPLSNYDSGEFFVVHGFGDRFPDDKTLTYETGYAFAFTKSPLDIHCLSRMYICVKGTYKNASGTLELPIFDIWKYTDVLKVWLHPSGKEDEVVRKLFDRKLKVNQILKLKNINRDVSS